MVQKQAQGEFNKKFRKSDEFKKDLPSEKVEAFSKILGKFFDNEAKDYKKELEMKTPDYDELLSRRNNKFDVTLPQVMVKQFDWVSSNVQAVKNEVMNKTEADQKAFFDKLPEAVGGAMKELTDKYVGARDEIQANCDHSKDWFKSQNTERYKTKADVIKAVWEVMPRLTGSPVPPIDDELLADLEQQPAVVEGAFRHSWGIADKLYKSEAIDAFGMKYLLGIFETKDE